MLHDKTTESIIAAAMRIHSRLGPGLLESAYRDLLYYKLNDEGWMVEREKTIPLHFEGIQIDHAFRVDLLVDRQVAVELKVVEDLRKVHCQQLLTYLRLGNFSTGLLINFYVSSLKYGIRRISNARTT